MSTACGYMKEISASKKQKHDRCPGDFRATYAPETRDDKKFRDTYRSYPMEVGNLIHKTLELAGLERHRRAASFTVAGALQPDAQHALALQNALAEPITEDELKRHFETALKSPDRFGDRLYACDTEIVSGASEILFDKRLLKAPWFTFKHLAYARPSNVVIEGSFKIALGKIGGDECSATGFLDRVDEPTPGEIRIVDYKSGQESLTADEAQWDSQVLLYLVAAHELFPNAREWKCELHYLAKRTRIGPIHWTPLIDWFTRLSYKETLRRIRTATSWKETPGWQCFTCWRSSVCASYKEYLKRQVAQIPIQAVPLETLGKEYLENEERAKELSKRNGLIEKRFYEELKSKPGLAVPGYEIKQEFGSNRTNYDPIKVADAFVDVGLEIRDLLACVTIGKEKLENKLEAIPDENKRARLEGLLELLGEKNSFPKLVWRATAKTGGGSA